MKERVLADHPPSMVPTCMGMLHVSDRTLGRGPHVRVDGRAAYNGYLWPMPADDFWADRHLHRRHSSRWHFCAIALLGGGWLAEGTISRLTETGLGPAWVYPTREAALRVAGARLVRTLRHARAWQGPDHVSAQDFRELVAWVFSVVGRPAPPVYVPPPPAPPAASPPDWCDLPLFRS